MDHFKIKYYKYKSKYNVLKKELEEDTCFLEEDYSKLSEIKNYSGSNFQNFKCKGNTACNNYINRCLYKKLDEKYPDDNNSITKILIKTIEQYNIIDTEHCFERFGMAFSYIDKDGKNLIHIAIMNHNLNFIKRYHNKINLDHLDKDNNSPLTLACSIFKDYKQENKNKLLKCIEFLFSQSVSLSNGKDFFEVCISENLEEILSIFEKNYRQKNQDHIIFKFYSKPSTQFYAVFANNIKAMSKIIDLKIIINESALFESFFRERKEICRLYLTKIFDKKYNPKKRINLLNQKVYKSNTIIHYLVKFNFKDFLKKTLILDEINFTFNTNFESPLYLAIKLDNFDIFQMFLQREINKNNATDLRSFVKIIEDIYSNYLDSLVNTDGFYDDSDINREIDGYVNLLNYAVAMKSSRIVKYFISNNINEFNEEIIVSTVKSSLFYAADQNNIELINNLIKNKAVNVYQGIKIYFDDDDDEYDDYNFIDGREIPHKIYGIIEYCTINKEKISDLTRRTILKLILDDLKSRLYNEDNSLLILFSQKPLDLDYLLDNKELVSDEDEDINTILDNYKRYDGPWYKELKREDYGPFGKFYRILPRLNFSSYTLVIDRNDILGSFKKIYNNNNKIFDNRIKIKFLNEIGQDEGGLTREFFSLLAKQLIERNYINKETNGYCTISNNPDSNKSNPVEDYIIIGKLFAYAIKTKNNIYINLNPIILHWLIFNQNKTDPEQSYLNILNNFNDISLTMQKKENEMENNLDWLEKEEKEEKLQKIKEVHANNVDIISNIVNKDNENFNMYVDGLNSLNKVRILLDDYDKNILRTTPYSNYIRNWQAYIENLLDYSLDLKLQINLDNKDKYILFAIKYITFIEHNQEFYNFVNGFNSYITQLNLKEGNITLKMLNQLIVGDSLLVVKDFNEKLEINGAEDYVDIVKNIIQLNSKKNKDYLNKLLYLITGSETLSVDGYSSFSPDEFKLNFIDFGNYFVGIKSHTCDNLKYIEIHNMILEGNKSLVKKKLKEILSYEKVIEWGMQPCLFAGGSLETQLQNFNNFNKSYL